ncbi:hypothetical protein QQ045_020425 [Rhodiola kirilowii]
MCIIPRKVLQIVSLVCARFLWKGTANGRGSLMVSWKEVCKEKPEEGLGLKDLSIMNDAMRINQLWEMAKDEDSVWKAWTKAYLTKCRNWWEDGITNKNSWIIKEMEASRALSFKCISISSKIPYNE